MLSDVLTFAGRMALPNRAEQSSGYSHSRESDIPLIIFMKAEPLIKVLFSSQDIASWEQI